MNNKLPSETTVYYDDLSGMNFNKPTMLNNVGWIELCGITRNSSTLKTIDVNGKMFNNADLVNTISNPYCIVFNKEKNEAEEFYTKLKKSFEEYKSSNSKRKFVIHKFIDYSPLLII